MLHVPANDYVGSLSLVRRFALLLAIDGAPYLFATRLVLRIGGGAGSRVPVLLVAVAVRLPALGPSPPNLGKGGYQF